MTDQNKSPPLFGPYEECFDGDNPAIVHLHVPKEDIAAMKNLILQQAHLAVDENNQAQRYKRDFEERGRIIERQAAKINQLHNVLQEHHKWHLAQGTAYAPDLKGGYIEWDAADAYSDSALCLTTQDALRRTPPTLPLTFNEFLAYNRERQKNWPSENWTLERWMTALTGEVGEAANIIKKIFRGDTTLDEAREALGKEFADIQTYLTIFADKAGIDLPTVTIDKFNEVSDRIGSPVKIPAPPKGGAT